MIETIFSENDEELVYKFRSNLNALCKFRQFADASQNFGNNYKTYGNYVPVKINVSMLKEFEVLKKIYKIESREIVNKVLLNDAKKTIDGAIYDELLKANTVATPVPDSSCGVSINRFGNPEYKNDIELNSYHVNNIINYFIDNNVEPYLNINNVKEYVCIGRPAAFTKIKRELELIKDYLNTSYGLFLFSGEIGRIRIDKNVYCRFVEQTTVISMFDNWENGKSSECFFFGENPITEYFKSCDDLIFNYNDKLIGWKAETEFVVNQDSVIRWTSKEGKENTFNDNKELLETVKLSNELFYTNNELNKTKSDLDRTKFELNKTKKEFEELKQSLLKLIK